MSSRPKKGLQTIRTMGNRFIGDEGSHKKLFALTLMEHEKARLSQAKMSARRRVARIDERLAEIQEEQSRLLRTMEDFPPTGQPANGESHPAKGPLPPGESSFRVTY